MPRKKNAQIRAEKAPNTTLQKQCEEIKNAQIRAKKAPNPTLQTLCQETKKKKLTNSIQEKHLTLPYKHYAKKKKDAKI